jgi:hypothetical protein
MRALPLVLALAACTELPPIAARVSPEALSAPSPVIVPLDDILAQAARPARAEAAQGALNARANRLRGARIPRPATGNLEARGQRLRERADALRNVTL